ncbi:unnamed protein product [Parajaminaea phylloscopi]
MNVGGSGGVSARGMRGEGSGSGTRRGGRTYGEEVGQEEEEDDFLQEAEADLRDYKEEVKLQKLGMSKGKGKQKEKVDKVEEARMARASRKKLLDLLDPSGLKLSEAWGEEMAAQLVRAGSSSDRVGALGPSGASRWAQPHGLFDDGHEHDATTATDPSRAVGQRPLPPSTSRFKNAREACDEISSEEEMLPSIPKASQMLESGTSSDEEMLPALRSGSHQGAARLPAIAKHEHSASQEEDEEMLPPPVGSKAFAQPSGDVHGPRPEFAPSSSQQDCNTPHVLNSQCGISIPACVNRFLRNYQREGVEFMYRAFKESRGAILADDMGLGKTVQVISFLAAIMRKTGGSIDLNRRIEACRAGRHRRGQAPDAVWPTCLILVPQSVVRNWVNELDTWGYFEHRVFEAGGQSPLRAFQAGHLDIVISSHEYAMRHIEELRDLQWTCVFVDEAHKLKNPETQLTKALGSFRATRSRFALTGTVIQNRNEEMWTLLNWTNPDTFGDQSAWKALVALPLKLGQSKEASPPQIHASEVVSQSLAQVLLPAFMLRRTKAIIASQMPTKRDMVVICPLAEEQMKACEIFAASAEVKALREGEKACPCGREDHEGLRYKARKCCSRLEAGAFFRALYLFSCLANHAALFFPDPREKTSDKAALKKRHEKQTEYTKAIWPREWQHLVCDSRNGLRTDLCGKWSVLRDLLSQWHQAGDKVLLFSRSLRLLDWLAVWVQRAGYRHLRLDGSTHASIRQTLVQQFNRDSNIFCMLISTGAGGTGLNLTGANKVIVFDPNWSPALDSQAIDRAYRIGQTRDVSVFRLIGAGTLEEVIYGRQVYKAQIANVSYTAANERRYFTGVEKVTGQEGELFGAANLLTFKRSMVRETLICDYDAEGANEQEEELWELAQESGETLEGNADIAGPSGEGGILRKRGTLTHEHQTLFARSPSRKAKKTRTGRDEQPRGGRRQGSTGADSADGSSGDHTEDDDEEVIGATAGSATQSRRTDARPSSSAIPWPPPRG